MQNKANSKTEVYPAEAGLKTAKSWQEIHPTCSTIVENSLQISSFVQNKAKVKIGKMNISSARIEAYDKKQRTTNNERYSKQSQTKPILETMDVNFCAIGYYESCPAVGTAGKSIDGLWENAKS